MYTNRDAMLSPERCHSSQLVVFDASWDDQESRVCVTHFIVTVHLTDSPAFIGKTLHKTKSVCFYVCFLLYY